VAELYPRCYLFPKEISVFKHVASTENITKRFLKMADVVARFSRQKNSCPKRPAAISMRQK
jgi:hypothetical protein